MIKVSIIVPHYNSYSKLRRLLKTIPNREDIEIIIVDDNSEEELKLEEREVIFRKNSSNKKSAGICRNIGLSLARGKWLIFADADDYFLPNAFKIIEKYLESESDIIYFTPTSIIEENKNKSFRHLTYEKLINDYLDLNLKEKIRYLFYVPWSKMIKKSLIKRNNIKFDEVLASNDIKFSVLAGHFAKKINCTKERIYCVTESKNSLTKNKGKEYLNSRIKVALETNTFLKKHNKKKYCIKYKGFILKNFKNNLIDGVLSIIMVIRYKLKEI